MIYISSPVFPRKKAVRSHHLAASPPPRAFVPLVWLWQECRSAKPRVPRAGEQMDMEPFPQGAGGQQEAWTPCRRHLRGRCRCFGSEVSTSAVHWIAVFFPRKAKGLDILSCYLKIFLLVSRTVPVACLSSSPFWAQILPVSFSTTHSTGTYHASTQGQALGTFHAGELQLCLHPFLFTSIFLD